MENDYISIGRNAGRNELDIPLGGMPGGICYIFLGRNAERNMQYIFLWEELVAQNSPFLFITNIKKKERSVKIKVQRPMLQFIR